MSDTTTHTDASPQAMPVPFANVALCLDDRDNVAIAKCELQAGNLLVDPPQPHARLTVRQSIPPGHKVALREIERGQPVLRYGQVLGLATQAIQPGEHVHIHNVSVHGVDREHAFAVDVEPVALVPESERRTFLGYRRENGQVGTRNYLAVISTVNCSAHVTRAIAYHFTPERLAAFPNVDGVIALTHPYGCPIHYPVLERTLVGMARHPNVGAYVLVGLGCETNQAGHLVEAYGLHCCEDLFPDGPPALVIQELGGIRKTVQAGIQAVERLLPAVNAVERTVQPISDLMLALQCGGSDSWSGVTANPVVGRMADALVRQGGTVVLAETPEIYGAEHLLTRRAVDANIGHKLLALVQEWEAYARRVGLELDDNRSVGNEAGGLTTIFEKSLGAVVKAGSTPLTGVYQYAEQVTAQGFAFMNSPGYDPVSVTGQVAGGCNLVVFTTGRGSVFGFKPAPSLKVSTTSALYERMCDDMDLDAGRVLDGADVDGVAAELLDLVLATASGQPSKSEAQGVGEAEFCPWNVEGTL